jgi:hypothetical protein
MLPFLISVNNNVKQLSSNKNNNVKAVGKGLHVNNLHNQDYDFSALIQSYPPLGVHVKINQYNNKSIDFADPTADFYAHRYRAA